MRKRPTIRGCAHCHSLELITRSRHNAAEFVKVVERMAGYPPLAFPLMPQRTPSPRIGGGEYPARTPAAEVAAAGGLSRHPQFERGNGLDLLAEDRAAPDRAAPRGSFTRLRSAEAHAATARRDRRFAGPGVVRELR